MARQYHTARGQQNEFAGDEGAARLHGSASRGLGEKLHGRAERNLREIPRLLERIHEPCGKGNIRVCLQARWKIDAQNAVRATQKLIRSKQRKWLRRNCRSLRFDFYYKRSQIWLEKRWDQVALLQLADL